MDGLPDNSSKTKSPIPAAENLAPFAVPLIHSQQTINPSKPAHPADEQVRVPLMVTQHEFGLDPALYGKGGQLQLQQARDWDQGPSRTVLEIPPLYFSHTAANVLEIPQVITPKSANTLEIPSEIRTDHPMEPKGKE
jgi:hypothetical protein